MESHKIHVPNHQPDIYLFPNEITVGKTWFKSQMFGNKSILGYPRLYECIMIIMDLICNWPVIVVITFPHELSEHGGISKYIHPICIQISKLWPSKNRENVFLKLAGFASDVEKSAIGFE